MGESNYDDIFYLTKYIEIFSPQHIINTKIWMRWFTFLFFGAKSLKPNVYITLTTHFNLDWLHSRAQYLQLGHVSWNIVTINSYLHYVYYIHAYLHFRFIVINSYGVTRNLLKVPFTLFFLPQRRVLGSPPSCSTVTLPWYRIFCMTLCLFSTV